MLEGFSYFYLFVGKLRHIFAEPPFPSHILEFSTQRQKCFRCLRVSDAGTPDDDAYAQLCYSFPDYVKR